MHHTQTGKKEPFQFDHLMNFCIVSCLLHPCCVLNIVIFFSIVIFLRRVPHQFISEMMAFTFTEIVKRIDSKLSTVLASSPNFPEKPVFFTDVTSKTMCFPALSSFSTLDDSTEAIAESVAKNEIGAFSPSFAPYKCSQRTKWCKFRGAKYKKKKFSMDHRYYSGWTFSQDRPGVWRGRALDCTAVILMRECCAVLSFYRAVLYR